MLLAGLQGNPEIERAAPSPHPPSPPTRPGVTEVIAALESSLYGRAVVSQADLEDEWSDLEQNARVVRDGDRIVGYGEVREQGKLWRAENIVDRGLAEFPDDPYYLTCRAPPCRVLPGPSFVRPP